MAICLSHSSALEYWRTFRCRYPSPPSATSVDLTASIKSMGGMTWAPGSPRTDRFKPDVGNEKILREAFELGVSSPLHVLVPRSDARFYEKGFINHLCTLPLPTNSLVKIADGLFVARPELCLLQMATLLDPLPLTALAFEFCGTYVLLGLKETLICDLMPLTNARVLRSFSKQIIGVGGVKRLRAILPHLIEGSASPMETAAALLLSLPCRLGGYGFPQPSMNTRVNASAYSRHATSKGYYRCDLFWQKAQLAVEYDSDAHHAYSERIFEDARRRNSLEYLGVSVITMTKRQILHQAECDAVARQIAKLLNIRIRPRNRNTWRQRQAHLRKQLFQLSTANFSSR